MSAAAAAVEPREHSLGRMGARRFARRPVAVASLVALVVVFGAGALASVLAPEGWNAIDLANVHASPSLSHLFGTDNVGRDMFTRTLYGARATAEVALAAAAIATLLGVVAGGVAGFYGGWRDAIVMRVADLVTAYPAVVLTLGAIVYFRPVYPHTLILIYAAIMWAPVARVVRAHVATLRGTEFVESARALGASDARIYGRHVLPNIAGTIAVAATSLVGQIVLVDATVEFFDYGLPASSAPSLGNLVADVVQFKFGLSTDVAVAGFGWWSWFFPGLVLVVILVCTNFVGDMLDESLNPGAAERR